jgi:hypothetical protein
MYNIFRVCFEEFRGRINVENFDELALTWDNDPRRAERAKVVAEEIIKAIPDLDKMQGFEYGCGTGLLSLNLQSHMSV